MEEVLVENSTHPPPPNPTTIPESTTPTARIICEVLFPQSPHEIIPALSSTGIVPSPNVVLEVLNLTYDHPFSAVKFFQWAGQAHKHSPEAWNLMVHILGRNRHFDSMWDAVRSMRDQATLSLATFVFAFANYCAAARFDDAIMTFQVMDKYGISQNVVAANSLLSAMCSQNGGVSRALEFLETMKASVDFGPDGDSFAILLEGLEKEGKPARAKAVFEEMVVSVGWSPANISAYNAFLATLVKGGETEEAVGFLVVMNKKGCLPGSKVFSNFVDVLVRKKCAEDAMLVWDIMVGNAMLPNLSMYNAMIGLMCDCNEEDHAFRLLDEMAFNGVFADSFSYNAIFKCLIKNNKVCEAGRFFVEMVKNECLPTHFNCAAAITMFYDGDDPEMGVEIWNVMVDKHVEPLDVAANALLLGLCKLDRLSELKRSADNMLDRRISIYESTMASLKSSYYKDGRGAQEKYDSLARRWKTSLSRW